MDIDNFPEARLTDLSCITHSYHLVRPANGSLVEILIIRFVGAYGVGSRGNSDASYMAAVAHAGLEAWNPQALVLDLRELDYQWGDMMASVLCAGDGRVTVIHAAFGQSAGVRPESLPTAVVVSNRCREALTSLVEAEMREDPTKWLFDSIDAAFAALPR